MTDGTANKTGVVGEVWRVGGELVGLEEARAARVARSGRKLGSRLERGIKEG